MLTEWVSGGGEWVSGDGEWERQGVIQTSNRKSVCYRNTIVSYVCETYYARDDLVRPC